jgi:Ion channel
MGRHVGARLQQRRASRSYGFVLALVVGTFVFTAAAPDTDWAASVLILIQALTLAAALWTSGLTGRMAPVTTVLVLVGAAAAAGQLVSGSRTSAGLAGLLDVLLVTGTCAVIVRGVASERTVNAQTVLGALCVYLLIGMFYTFTYGTIASLDSGPFFAQGTDGTPSVRLYFSFVTLSTVGYGDYSAASDLGRTLAATEALLGQLYLVTVVALVVSRLRLRRATS